MSQEPIYAYDTLVTDGINVVFVHYFRQSPKLFYQGTMKYEKVLISL